MLQKNGAACEDSPMNNSNSCGEGVRFGIAARDLALEQRIIFGHAAAPKPTPGRSRKKRLRRGSHRLSTVAVFQESEISVAGASRKGRSAVAVSGPGGREPNESHRRDVRRLANSSPLTPCTWTPPKPRSSRSLARIFDRKPRRFSKSTSDLARSRSTSRYLADNAI